MSDHQYTVTQSFDADEHAASLSSWDQWYEQISAGPFLGRVEDLRMGPLQIFREHTTQAVLQSGRARSGCITLGLPCYDSGRASFCGHRLSADTPIAASSGEEFDLLTTPGMELLAISINTDLLASLGQRVHGSNHELRLPGNCVLKALNERQTELNDLISSALELARVQPRLLAQPAVRRTLALSMADVVLECITPDHVVKELPGCAATRQRIVRMARDYMQTHADEVITVPDLCEATHASRRALQYAFEDVLQVSPVTYLRCMRLNRVRRDLARDPDAHVGDVAARWGFWHLSRFAADYRELFGELPSGTRKRANFSSTGSPSLASA
jgi:AraC family ethanolamine operon transcriptional activator